MDKLKIFVLAGGKGTRLWPLSRENFPKQFINFFGNKSLYEQTLLRAMKLTLPENIFIISSKDYEDVIKGYTLSINERIAENIMIEPEGKNTLPATLLGCFRLNPDDIFLVMPSDHFIAEEDRFVKAVETAVKLAEKGGFVTFGIKPFKPETGFGYIEVAEKSKDFLKVKNFVEKPDLERAKIYLKSGNYYWNSGIFVFNCKAFLGAAKKYEPETYKLYTKGENYYLSNYATIKSQSLDYGIMEKVDKNSVFMVPATFQWSDLGSFEAIYQAAEKDASGVAKMGQADVFSLESKNNLIFNDDKLLVTIGIEDVVYVETEDAVLLMKKGLGEKLKEVNKLLKEQKRPEVNYNKTGYRPWGSYTVILQGERYKIKKIVVNPMAALSLQMHHHRSEHWVVIKGTAKVTLGDEVVFVHENESIYIPKSTLHRLENPGKVDLEVIEVQNGEYLEEDDIVRFQDAYGRGGK